MPPDCLQMGRQMAESLRTLANCSHLALAVRWRTHWRGASRGQVHCRPHATAGRVGPPAFCAPEGSVRQCTCRAWVLRAAVGLCCSAKEDTNAATKRDRQEQQRRGRALRILRTLMPTRSGTAPVVLMVLLRSCLSGAAACSPVTRPEVQQLGGLHPREILTASVTSTARPEKTARNARGDSRDGLSSTALLHWSQRRRAERGRQTGPNS